MAEQLGSLARTHTCGALASRRRREECGAARLGASRPRHGIAAVPRRARSPRPDAGHRRRRRGAARARQAHPLGVRRRRSSARSSAARRTPSTRSLPTGEVEIRAKEVRILNEAKTPPFSIAEDQNVSEETRLKYRYLDLRRPQLQHNIGLRHRITMALRKYFDEQRFLRDRDADPDEVDAGRRARLPGAGARASGRVLRAAAVAADLQADPDDCRLRSLRADRALLPRRGAARRSPARIHAGRPRDVVCDAADGVRDRRRRAGRVLQGDRRRHSAAVQAHAVCGGDGEVRIGQARPALRHGDPGLRSAVRAVAVRDLP